MIVDQVEIGAILNELLSISRSEGALILSSEGNVVGSKFSKDFIKSKLILDFKNLLEAMLNITLKVNFGNPEQLFVQGTKRKIFIYNVSEESKFYVILFGISDMNTGLANIAIEKTIPSIEKVIQ